MSVDLDTIRSEFKEILLNQNAIKINQDPLGIPGQLVSNVSIFLYGFVIGVTKMIFRIATLHCGLSL